MPDLRPNVTPEQALSLLKQQFNPSIGELVALEGGQVARTFAFRADGQEYVLRFNLDKMLNSNFPKEAYVTRKLAGTSIPVAPILQTGYWEGLQFAISRRLPGKMLEAHTPQEVRALVPQIVNLLQTLGQVDISDTQGYGVFDDQGRGMSISWEESLRQIYQEESEENYFGKWYHLFEDSFLERDLYEHVYQRMCELLSFYPGERGLVYGNLSLRNLLAQDGKLTGALNWLSAAYGDLVYDLATLDFWSSWLGVSEAFEAEQQRRGQPIPFYSERLLCYECHHALIGLRFFAQGDDEQGYRMTRAIIQQRLDAAPKASA